MNPFITQCCRELLAHPARPFSRRDALKLLEAPAADTLDVLALGGLARSLNEPGMFRCGILNAKSGRCPEDCAFCAQSAHYRTGAPEFGFCGEEKLLRRAEELARAGALRFGVVTSGSALGRADLDALCRAAQRIRREVGIRLCASLGQLTVETGKQLREAGFESYHHNLETSADYFPTICTTHAYEQDLETLRAARSAGLRVCSGGILGLGESLRQRVELARTLAELEVDSIPLNFLTPIEGTPLESQPLLSAAEALRGIAIFRLLNPGRDILVCGGGERVLGRWRSWIFAAGANGLMIGDYLTTPGCDPTTDAAMFEQLGLPDRG